MIPIAVELIPWNCDRNWTHATITDNSISQNGEEGIRNHGISAISGIHICNNNGFGIWVLIRNINHYR